MLIAARNAMMAGSWRNPYVTDGLVAFYDGTWNAGPDKHNAALTAPVNLVTGEASTPNGGGVAFDSNSMVLTSTSQGYASQSLPIDTGDITIDILLKADTASPSGYFRLSASAGSTRFLKCEHSDVSSAGTIKVGWGITTALYPIDMTGSANEIQQKVCVVYRGSKLSLFTNGVLSMDYAYTGSVGGGPVIFGNKSVSSSQPNGNIYRILVYAGAKTADEIAANYAVDKARFNLP